MTPKKQKPLGKTILQLLLTGFVLWVAFFAFYFVVESMEEANLYDPMPMLWWLKMKATIAVITGLLLIVIWKL